MAATASQPLRFLSMHTPLGTVSECGQSERKRIELMHRQARLQSEMQVPQPAFDSRECTVEVIKNAGYGSVIGIPLDPTGLTPLLTAMVGGGVGYVRYRNRVESERSQWERQQHERRSEAEATRLSLDQLMQRGAASVVFNSARDSARVRLPVRDFANGFSMMFVANPPGVQTPQRSPTSTPVFFRNSGAPAAAPDAAAAAATGAPAAASPAQDLARQSPLGVMDPNGENDPACQIPAEDARSESSGHDFDELGASDVDDAFGVFSAPDSTASSPLLAHRPMNFPPLAEEGEGEGEGDDASEAGSEAGRSAGGNYDDFVLLSQPASP